MAKVLIIEDDDVIARGMARHLETAGFDAVGVANGETGLARLRYERPDVCVLDLMLPGIDGWRVIEQARDEGIGTPIVVVSARGTEHDRVHALEIGADDYLVKPFSLKELAARVRAAARRGVSEAEPRRGDAIVIEELRLDPDNVQAYVDGASAELTPTEFRLVYTLAREQGRVLTRDELLQRVWGRRATHRDRTVDVFVRKLREKIDRRAPRTRSSTRATASATSSRPSRSSATSRGRCGRGLDELLLQVVLGIRERSCDEPGNGSGENGDRSDIECRRTHEERHEQNGGEGNPQHGRRSCSDPGCNRRRRVQPGEHIGGDHRDGDAERDRREHGSTSEPGTERQRVGETLGDDEEHQDPR